MTRVFNCEGLVQSVIKYFVPALVSPGKKFNFPMFSSLILRILDSKSGYEMPLMQAVKFLRVLCSRSKHISTTMIEKFQIMDSIIAYLANENYSLNATGLKLQIECFHLWSVLVNYGLALDYFTILQPVLLKLLEYHANNTDLDGRTSFIRQGHAGALLVFLSQVSNKQFSLLHPFVAVIFDRCLPKWATQFAVLECFAVSASDRTAKSIKILILVRQTANYFFLIVSSRWYT